MKQLPVVFFSFLLAAPALASAADGDVPTLAAGSRVRAKEAGGGRLTAEVVDVLPDALLVRLSPHAPTRRLDLSRLERLEVSGGRHGHAGTGFLVGFVPGAALGVLAGGFACLDYEGPGHCDHLGPSLVGAVYFGAITGAAGALIGWAIQTERWKPLDLPARPAVRLQPHVAPVRGGVAAGLRLSF